MIRPTERVRGVVDRNPPADGQPQMSVIIPVRDNLTGLRVCLRTLAAQEDAPSFEIIVVDDGSRAAIAGVFPPAAWPCHGRLVRQVALGIAAARNRGIAAAHAPVVVFIDSDVLLEKRTLAEFARILDQHPADALFQLQLVGGRGSLAQRMERLRLIATHHAFETIDGHVGYLNTSACAVRRSAIETPEFFPVCAVRGEDTHVLARFSQRGVRPRLAAGAVAWHRPGTSLPRYLWKHLAIGYWTTPARLVLRAAPGRRLRAAGRWQLYADLWRIAWGHPRDQLAAALIAPAYLLECLGRCAGRAYHVLPAPADLFALRLDVLNASEIIVRVLEAIRRQRSLTLTYLTAWTLVRANRNPHMATTLRSFDVCYADGMGVAHALFLLTGRHVGKVTANEFFFRLCDELRLENRTIALIGGTLPVIRSARRVLAAQVSGVRIVLCAHGYLGPEGQSRLQGWLRRTQPDVVFLGMGQPRQEEWVLAHRATLPHAVFFCVGGLFDYLAGVKPTPPRWMRASGFEWLYLLLARPRRFWHRYLVGLPMLGLDIVRHHVSRLRRRRHGTVAMPQASDA